MVTNSRISNSDPPERCQVCIIGSGAGGAVVAAELAEAGFDVVVLEEGGYHPTPSLTHDPLRMLPRLYRNAGGDATLGRAPIMFTEGRCVGGGTVINAGICYRTPPEVLHHWALALGNPDFLPESMQAYFEEVERELHVTEVPDELFTEDTRKMRAAAEALDYHYVRVRRNIHACQGTNMCLLGCPTGAKQSTLVTFLPRATRAGARIHANCRVNRLLLDGDRVVGVAYSRRDPLNGKLLRRGTIAAEWVFVAGGGMQTPTLLHNSGIRKKLKMVGRTLFLHPNTKCVGIFPDEIHAWQGSVQGIQIDEFSDEGLTFGSTFLPPGVLALSLPFYGREIDEVMQRYNHLSIWGILAEDSHPGRIYFTPGGQPVATYRLIPSDVQRFKEGIVRLARLFFAAGAESVIAPVRGFEYIRSPDDLKRFSTRRLRAGQLSLFSVHLLGTCRMGLDPRTSVVNPQHRVHGLRNLFITDASVLPGPIRVNPMITIMSLARRAARMFAENAHALRRAA